MEKIVYKKALGEQVEKLDNVYDLAAFTYDYLNDIVENQGLFLGGYVKANKKAAMTNPNLLKLRRFSWRIEKILRKQEDLGLSFSECLKQVMKSMESLYLAEYGETVLNQATIPFYVLMAIDRYVLEKAGIFSEREPKNHTYSEKSYVYLNKGNDILDEAMEESNFSDVIAAPTIRKSLSHLIILEKNELPDRVDPPKVVSLFVDEKELDDIFVKKRLKIAIVPFGEQEMVRFPVDKGALFHVEYVDRHLNEGSKRALSLLDRAIESKANIIIFPEFICFEGIQREIQEHLVRRYHRKANDLKNLLFVVAGSGWTKDNNNVAAIYSSSGRLLGKQYKYSPFSDLKRDGVDNMIENLQNPGKETTIIDIKGIGKVIIGICRDVSAREYTRMLAEVYAPQLLLTPAWSRSVNIGFKEQFREITAQNHKTCSVLCNCCEALIDKDKFRENNGIIVTPYKDGSVISGKVKAICRKEETCSRCAEQGCIFLANIYCDALSVKKGKMVKRISCIGK